MEKNKSNLDLEEWIRKCDPPLQDYQIEFLRELEKGNLIIGKPRRIGESAFRLLHRAKLSQ